jgi:hypothetical protein
MMKTGTKTETVAVGWEIPISVKDQFTDFCIKVGGHYQHECAGALLAWQHLPAEVREFAKLEAKGQPPDTPEEFWKGLAAALKAGFQVLRETPADMQRTGRAKAK